MRACSIREPVQPVRRSSGGLKRDDLPPSSCTSAVTDGLHDGQVQRRARHLDSTQLVRQWALLGLLSRSGRSLSIKELADQLQTSKSSIERDLATLEQHFALLEEAEGSQRRRYRIDREAPLVKSLRFTVMELLALEAADALMGASLGDALRNELKTLIHKLRGLVGSPPGYSGAFGGVFLHHPRARIDYSTHTETIDTLLDGIVRRKVCRGRYRAAWDAPETTRELWPLRLLAHEGALYVLCYAPASKGVRTFAVHRFVEIDALPRSFTPPTVDLVAETRRAFGVFSHARDEAEVEILFSPEFAWMIAERVFHPDESKERLPDGRLRYRVRSSAKWEIIPWVLRFGGEAELIAPIAWREEIRARTAALRERHG